MSVIGRDDHRQSGGGLQHTEPVRGPLIWRARRIQDGLQGVVDRLAFRDLMFDPSAGTNADLVQLWIAVRPGGECGAEGAVAGDHRQPRLGQ